MKRYVSEPGSTDVIAAMEEARRWWICRIGYAETLRAIAREAGFRGVPARRFRAEWSKIDAVEVDQELVETAAALADAEDLRTIDALHLSSALRVPDADRAFASWDARLWKAARNRGLKLIPARLA